MLILQLPMQGCRRAEETQPGGEDTRLVGRWEVDLPQTEANLRARLAVEASELDSADREAKIAAQLDRLSGREMVVTASTFEIKSDRSPLRGNYVVAAQGERDVVLRIAPGAGPGSVDLTHLNDQQLADQLEIKDGLLPFRLGFLFLDEDHVQVFHRSVRDGQVVDARSMSPEVFRRVSTAPEESLDELDK